MYFLAWPESGERFPGVAVLSRSNFIEMSNTTQIGATAIMMSRLNSEAFGLASLGKEPKKPKKRSLITLRTLPVDQQRALHYEDLWGCFTRNFGKGFALGMITRIGANAFWMLISILRKRKVPSAEAVISLLAPGSTEFGVFAGSMLSIFNTFVYLTKNADEDSAVGHYRGAIAGALAGTSLLLAPKSIRWTIMLSILVRAVEMHFKMLIKNKWMPSFLHPDNYGDVIIMGAASAVNIHFLAMNQGAFNFTYRKFLNNFSLQSRETLQALEAMARGVPIDIPGTCHGTNFRVDPSVPKCKYSGKTTEFLTISSLDQHLIPARV